VTLAATQVADPVASLLREHPTISTALWRVLGPVGLGGFARALSNRVAHVVDRRSLRLGRWEGTTFLVLALVVGGLLPWSVVSAVGVPVRAGSRR
jgi:hypothetical protein